MFIWSSTRFGRHTAHHEEPKTALAASGFAYVEGCWTCGCWTLSALVFSSHWLPDLLGCHSFKLSLLIFCTNFSKPPRVLLLPLISTLPCFHSDNIKWNVQTWTYFSCSLVLSPPNTSAFSSFLFSYHTSKFRP